MIKEPKARKNVHVDGFISYFLLKNNLQSDYRTETDLVAVKKISHRHFRNTRSAELSFDV